MQVAQETEQYTNRTAETVHQPGQELLKQCKPWEVQILGYKVGNSVQWLIILRALRQQGSNSESACPTLLQVKPPPWEEYLVQNNTGKKNQTLPSQPGCDTISYWAKQSDVLLFSHSQLPVLSMFQPGFSAVEASRKGKKSREGKEEEKRSSQLGSPLVNLHTHPSVLFTSIPHSAAHFQMQHCDLVMTWGSWVFSLYPSRP